MSAPNACGVYEPQYTIELARIGRSVASITIAQCQDGQFRYATHLHYSYGGFSGPITDRSAGFASRRDAEDAALGDLVRRFPQTNASDPTSVHAELKALRARVEEVVRQPSLF